MRTQTASKNHWREISKSKLDDGTATSVDLLLTNLDNGKELQYSGLVPLMIERYGFYEGKGTPYRVEPSEVLEVFPFLKEKAKKAE